VRVSDSLREHVYFSALLSFTNISRPSMALTERSSEMESLVGPESPLRGRDALQFTIGVGKNTLANFWNRRYV
jgi:hypothetical protein